ncbi:hypothetical protein [Streptomyces sp. SM10]|uniref:hypothetical protein n=1 Tax=Streptomyces sp. SM10 TaxID=565556 RepID=UPI000CDB753C|nr:hypothetical protein [Streptomyces sp. SM10]
MRKPSRTAAPAALCGLALLATGCSGGSREYALPKDLRGVPVGEEELSPLLQDGEKLDVRGGLLATSTSICSVGVDDYPSVDAQVEKVDTFDDPMGELDSFRFTNRRAMAMVPLPFDGAGAMGDRNVMISARCAAPEADHPVVYISVGEKAQGDVGRRRADTERFALAFVPSAKKEIGCTA